MKTSDDDRRALDAAGVGQERGTMDNRLGNAGHILVADDDPTIRRTIVSYFEEHKVPASCASSAKL